MRHEKNFITALLIAISAIAPAALPATAAPEDGSCDLTLGDGTSGAPYQLASQIDMLELTDCDGSGKHFILTSDIAFTGTWSPLATSSSPFIGNFDGGGHAISDVLIDSFSLNTDGASVYRDGLGLFAAVRGSSFSSFSLEVVVDINNGPGTGTIVNLGALTGHADNSSFVNISSSFTVGITSGASSLGTVGGLVGQAQSNMNAALNYSSIGTQSLSFDRISASLTYKSGAIQSFGGIVAKATMASTKNLEISKSGAIVTPLGSGSLDYNSGGLSGATEGNVRISNSYVRGDLKLYNTNTKRIGGLLGQILNGTALIENSYAAVLNSNFSTQTSISPTIAHSFGTGVGTHVLTSVYWDETLSTASSHVGGTGESTSTLNSFATFDAAGWDILSGYSTSSTWGIHPQVNDGYPFLISLYPSDPTPTPPTFNSSSVLQVNEGEQNVSTLTSTPSSTWTLISDPSGFFSIDASSGALTISPLATVGTYTISVQFEGSNGGFDQTQLTVSVVSAVAHSPASTPGPAPEIAEILEFSKRTLSTDGDSVSLWGKRLGDITFVAIGGVEVSVSENTDTFVSLVIPTLPSGNWNLELRNSYGALTFQDAFAVSEPSIEYSRTGELLGYQWTLRFVGNSRTLSDAQAASLDGAVSKYDPATTIVCWGYTTASVPNAWAIAHATARAKAACDYLSDQMDVKAVIRLRYGVEKSYAMRSAIQFWK